MTTPPLPAGQRFIGSCDFYWMAGIAKILKQGLRGLRDKARKIPSIIISPDFLVIAIFDPVREGAVRAGEAAPGLVGRRSPTVRLDHAAGPGEHSRHRQEPPGAGSGLG
jgi:hypothetical protein